MFKKVSPLIIILVIMILPTSCASVMDKEERAQQALQDYFDRLSIGEYASATDLYGGSYETLVSFNPELDQEDHAALWQNGCQINGLQCLDVLTATYNETTATGEYIFTVQFANPDGSLFVREACCGEEPTEPPQHQFEYRVVEGGDGEFRVLDLPVYVP